MPSTAKTHRRNYLGPASLALALALLPGNAKAISFVLNDVTPGGMSAQALAGFQQAVGIWQTRIFDEITVNIDIRFDGYDFSGQALGGNTLGSAGSATVGFYYADVRTALAADITSADDAIAVAGLPPGPALSFLTNSSVDGSVFMDNNGTGNNLVLDITTANAKALGLIPAHNLDNDAGLAFNNAFSWDFDQSDGIGAGLQDFVGVTVHEIGHALGFVSGVDTVDLIHGNGPYAGIDLDPYRVHSVLDLYRYSGAGVLDFTTGGNPYFSIDGGETALAGFSTGYFNGDGSQASHWIDNFGIGIMDPTANPAGNANTLSALDLRAFDVIGYQMFAPIPEPVAAMLAALGLVLAVFRRRR